MLDWVVLTTLLAGLAVWLGQGPADSVAGRFTRLDTAFFDFANRARRVAWPDHAVLVEIDESSLARIGRWPWPRAIHAALLDVLQGAGARAIGLDLLLAEDAFDDRALVDALGRAPRTVLAVAHDVQDGQREWPIYPVFADGGVGRLGHVHFGLDRDGLVRGLHLVEGGLPAFALALHALANEPSATPQVGGAMDAVAATLPAAGDEPWSREHFALLPQLAADGQRLSYAAVLAGEVATERLRGKTVLVGATATGLRDAFSTPAVAGLPFAPGALLHVATLAALERNGFATRIPAAWQAAVAAAVVLATMAALYLSRPRGALVAVTAAGAATLAATALALAQGLWIPPAGTLVALLLAYPLWSWRRLELLVGELQRQVPALRETPTALRAAGGRRDPLARLIRSPAETPRRWFDPPPEAITREVATLQAAATAGAALRDLLAAMLDRLPHGALILDRDGGILLANRRARDAFGDLDGDARDARTWLGRHFSLPAGWLGETDAPRGTECRDETGRDWLIEAVRFDAPGLPVLGLVQFSDVSTVREMQRQREQMMRFISHDLRSPQVSILAAIEQIEADRREPVHDRIATLARHALRLADDFVHWAVAEQRPLAIEGIDLGSLMTEAADSIWARARALGARIELRAPDDGWLAGDRTMLARALTNLLENALRHGGAGIIEVGADRREGGWAVTVADRGPGLPPGDPQRLFEAYTRGGTADGQGLGLGLAYVRLVADRHGGRVRAARRAGGGAEFTLWLPADDRPSCG